jgi:hypothetical protein
MKVRFIGEGSPLTLTKNKIYEVIAEEVWNEETNWIMYRIIDETGEDYLYHKSNFEIVEE